LGFHVERRLSPLVAGIGLAGALAWFTLGASGRGAAAPGTAALAADVDARLRETIAGVQARADTLAQLPRLGLAVATDERTVLDLTTDELAFRTKPGEHIEIAQIARGNAADGAVRSLLRLPDDKLPLAMASQGPHVVIVNGQLQVVVYVPVTPRDRADVLRGALAVAQAPDLSAFVPRFEALGLAGRIEVGGQAMGLAGGEAASGAASATVPLTTAAPEAVTLAFVAAPGGGAAGGKRPIAGPLAVLLLSLVGAAFLWRQGQSAPLPAPASPSSIRPAVTVAPAPADGTKPPAAPTPPAGAKPPPAPTPTAGVKPPPAPTPAAGLKPPPAPTPAAGLRPPPAPTPAAGLRPPPTPTPGHGVGLGARPAASRTPPLGALAGAKSGPSATPPVGVPRLPPPRPSIPPPTPRPIEAPSADTDGTPGPELLDHEDSTGPNAVPAPLSGPVNLSQPSARASRPRLANEPSRATATLPTYLFEGTAPGDGATGGARGANEDALAREYRELYVEFIKMRRTCREPVDNLNADHFVAALRKQHHELSHKYGNREIHFRIAFDNGKAAIRFSVG
jgi:hypothetical protein